MAMEDTVTVQGQNSGLRLRTCLSPGPALTSRVSVGTDSALRSFTVFTDQV